MAVVHPMLSQLTTLRPLAPWPAIARKNGHGTPIAPSDSLCRFAVPSKPVIGRPAPSPHHLYRCVCHTMPVSCECLLIYNRHSGKAQADDFANDLLASRSPLSVCQLDREVDLDEPIGRAIESGCEKVVAAGGDGTVNAVVNALMQFPAHQRPELGILPMGTANDFAGTLMIPDDLTEASEMADNGQTVEMDVIRIRGKSLDTYFANVAAGGNSVRVSEQMTDEIKQTWGALSYIRGAVDVLADMQPYRVIIDCDDQQKQLDSWGILIANGRTNAGRIPVAPEASPCDGWMDVVIIREGTVLDMAEMVSKTLLSSFLECEQVDFCRAKTVELRSDPPMRFTLDGEVIEQEPVRFEIVPAAIRVRVGAGFAC